MSLRDPTRLFKIVVETLQGLLEATQAKENLLKATQDLKRPHNFSGDFFLFFWRPNKILWRLSTIVIRLNNYFRGHTILVDTSQVLCRLI